MYRCLKNKDVLFLSAERAENEIEIGQTLKRFTCAQINLHFYNNEIYLGKAQTRISLRSVSLVLSIDLLVSFRSPFFSIKSRLKYLLFALWLFHLNVTN